MKNCKGFYNLFLKNKFNKVISRKIAYGRSFIFILFLSFLSIPHLKAQVIDKIIGKVDNEIILKSEIELAYIQYLAGGQEDTKGDLKCQILENSVVNKLLVAKAAIDSVVVDKVTVEDQLNRRMEYFISQI